jgi:hypothetical protein
MSTMPNSGGQGMPTSRRTILLLDMVISDGFAPVPLRGSNKRGQAPRGRRRRTGNLLSCSEPVPFC